MNGRVGLRKEQLQLANQTNANSKMKTSGWSEMCWGYSGKDFMENRTIEIDSVVDFIKLDIKLNMKN